MPDSPPTPTLDEIEGVSLAIFPSLDDDGRAISLAVYRLLGRGKPASVDAIAALSEVDPDTVAGTLDGWPGVFRNDEGAVVGYWGLALGGTQHGFEVDGQALTAWCAYDTLFMPALLGCAAKVTSTDPETGEAIELTVQADGTATASSGAVWMSFLMPDETMLDDVISSFCRHILFFGSEESGRRFTSTRPGAFLLSLDDAVELSRRRTRAMYGLPEGR